MLPGFTHISVNTYPFLPDLRAVGRLWYTAEKEGGAPSMEYMSCVELDIHGMTQAQAETAIEARLRRAKGVYRIRVIHGYTRGTALRDFVRSRYRKHPKVLRVEAGLNPGATDLVLREY